MYSDASTSLLNVICDIKNIKANVVGKGKGKSQTGRLSVGEWS